MNTTTIQDAVVIPLLRIPDERGTIYHILSSTDAHFDQFGEIYFASVYRGVVKGWHKHREMTLNYACVFGPIKLVLYGDRDESPTRAALQELFLGPDNHALAVIASGAGSTNGRSSPAAGRFRAQDRMSA